MKRNRLSVAVQNKTATPRTCAGCAHSKPDIEGWWLWCQLDRPPSRAVEVCANFKEFKNEKN